MHLSIQKADPFQRIFRLTSVIDAKNKIIFEGGRVEIDKNGIVKFTTDVDKLLLEHAQNLIDCLKNKTFDDGVLLLFDAKSLQESTSGEVKSYTVTRLDQSVKALAVLNNSSISRFLIHTFIAMYRPKVPVRMFDQESDAKRWLLDTKGQIST